MLKFLRAGAFICLILTGTLSIAESIDVTDKQAEYKEAFESAQRFHQNRLETMMLRGRPSSVDSHERTWFESFRYAGHKIKLNLGRAIDYTVGELKSGLRKLNGTKGAPPTSGGLFYTFSTGGISPEVLWYPDLPVDSDGYIVRYEFTFGDGTSQNILATELESGKTISHVYSQPGTYTASVKIVDNDEDFSIYTGSITVTSTNTLPVPKFTLQNNQVPNFLKVDFTSQATDNAGITRYTWRFGDGSSDVVGSGATTASRTYVNPGVYTVGLVVRDTQRGQMSAYTQAYVGQHQPSGGMYPIPLVFADTLSGTAPLVVQFDGEKSFDIGGSIASYEWNFGDYSNPLNISNLSKPNYRYMQPGTYYGSLKVVDNGGRSNTRYFAVYVHPDGVATEPAEIFALPSSSPRVFSFDSNYRSIHAAVPSYYQIWDFGDGTPIVKGNYPVHTYGSDGTYTVTLKLYDVKGGFQQIQKTLIVNSNQDAPISQFYPDIYDTVVGDSIEFTTSNSSFVSNTTTALWDFGDGTRLTGLHKDLLSVNHTYSSKGLYVISLITTDELGKTSISTQYMNIQNVGRPITAVIDLSTKVGTMPLPVKYDASRTTSSAGAILKYHWQIWNPSATQVNHNKTWTSSYSTSGDRYVNLFVEDSQGNVGYAADFLSVVDPQQIPGGNQNPVANIQMDFSQTGNTSEFTASGLNSTDPDGDRIVSYEWIFDGSPVSSWPTVNIQSVGKDIAHMISLRVKDKWGVIGEKKVTFRNPSLWFDFAPKKPVVGMPSYFVADHQTMNFPDGEIVEYRWNFGDGSPEQMIYNPTHTFAAVGTYNVILKVKDVHGRSYRYAKDIVVRADGLLEAVITVGDVGGVIAPQPGMGFSWSTMPLSVNFDLAASDTFGRSIVSATWDFGDGTTGFGLNPSYTYYRPGVYTVTVNATDSNDYTDSSSVVLEVIGSNCGEHAGVEGCLRLLSARGKTLPMSLSEWLISHDGAPTLTWNPDVGDTSYVQATALNDELATPINITSAIVVDGANLKLQKSVLQTIGFDFTKEYEIVVRTKLSDDSEYEGVFPALDFGVGSLDLSTVETGVKIILESSSGYKRFIDLGASISELIVDLPLGTYSVYAEKGIQKKTHTVVIDGATSKSLTVDFSAPNVPTKNNHKSVADIYRTKFLSGRATNQCGEVNPFPYLGYQPALAPGMERLRFFNAIQFPNEPIIDHPLDRILKKKIKLWCSILGNPTSYSFMKWHEYDSVKRCEPGWETIPGRFNAWYLLRDEMFRQAAAPVEIEYKISDTTSGRFVSGIYTTNMNKILSERGTNLENITYLVGFDEDPDRPLFVDYDGLTFFPEFEVPQDYLRPTVALTLRSYEVIGGFGIACSFNREKEVLPRILSVHSAVGTGVAATNTKTMLSQASRHSDIDNGIKLKDSKLFPFGIDSTVYGFLGSNIFKAKVLVKMDSGTFLPEDITSVKISLQNSAGQRMGGASADQEYILQESDRIGVEPGSSEFYALVIVDATNFANHLQYQVGGPQNIKLIFTPMGSGIDSEKVGTGSIENITPLYNVKNNAQICSRSNYGSNIVQYARSSLLDEMYRLTDPANGYGIEFLCNDMSLPWGGLFQGISEAEPAHKFAHRWGRNADIRYFNTTAQEQNNYDGGYAINRKNDVAEYLKFSFWAYKVATATDINSDYYKTKERMLATCTYGATYAPCDFNTTIVDMTWETILKLCQWHSFFDTGCYSEAPNFNSAVSRYSTWVEHNVRDLKKMDSFEQTVMSDGSYRYARLSPLSNPSGFPEISSAWQVSALDLGQWPDGTTVYKSIGQSILPENIASCHGPPYHGCELQKRFKKDDDIHIHHIHLTR